MKKLLFVLPALLLFAMIGAPNSRADSYTPTFTCTGDCSAVTPSAAATSFPGGLHVFFPTPPVPYGFGISLYPQDSPTDAYVWSITFFPQPLDESENGWIVTILDQTTGLSSGGFVPAEVFPGPSGENGTLTFSPVSAATPEPAPVLLMLLGAGLIFLMRKRFTMRVPRTT